MLGLAALIHRSVQGCPASLVGSAHELVRLLVETLEDGIVDRFVICHQQHRYLLICHDEGVPRSEAYRLQSLDPNAGRRLPEGRR